MELDILAAVKQHPDLAVEVKNPDLEVMTIAIENDPQSIFKLVNPPPQIRKLAIGKRPDLIKLIKDPTDEEIVIAAHQRPARISMLKRTPTVDEVLDILEYGSANILYYIEPKYLTPEFIDELDRKYKDGLDPNELNFVPRDYEEERWWNNKLIEFLNRAVASANSGKLQNIVYCTSCTWEVLERIVDGELYKRLDPATLNHLAGKLVVIGRGRMLPEVIEAIKNYKKPESLQDKLVETEQLKVRPAKDSKDITVILSFVSLIAFIVMVGTVLLYAIYKGQ